MGRPDPDVLAKVQAVVTEMGLTCRPPTDYLVDLHRAFPRARAAAAKLIGVPERTIALVESTSHGLGLLADALPLRSGDNVLVCDLEFLPTTLCWRSRQRKLGLEVRPVPTRGGRVEVEDFEARMDGRTRVIAVSAVQEINGFRAPVAALAELAHAHGAWLIVDGIQEVGVLAVEAGALGADAYCAGGHKWLCNPLGMGFLYLGEALMERCEPSFYSYFNLVEPAGGWGEYLSSPERSPFDPLGVTSCASRFETGAYSNVLGAMALAESLERLCDYGPEMVQEKALALGDRLVAGLERRGFPLVSHLQPEVRSGIVTFNLQGGREQELRLNRYLDSQGVFVTVRYTTGVGGVRVSAHHFNTQHEVDLLLAEVEAFLASDAIHARQGGADHHKSWSNK